MGTAPLSCDRRRCLRGRWVVSQQGKGGLLYDVSL